MAAARRAETTTATAIPAVAPVEIPLELACCREGDVDVDCACPVVIVSVRPSVVVRKTVCPPEVVKMSLELILVDVGELVVVEALTGEGEDREVVVVELEVVVVEPSSSVLELLSSVLESLSSVLESSLPLEPSGPSSRLNFLSLAITVL